VRILRMGSTRQRGDDSSGTADRSYAFLLSRITLIIATSYMVLAQRHVGSVSVAVVGLILFGLGSSLLAFRLPRRWLEAPAVTAGVLVLDTAWITAVLLLSGSFEAEFFYLYFFVLFIAAIGERLVLIALGAVVVCAAYLYALSSSGAGSLFDSSALIRIPFLFTVATFYGYLVDRVRREQQKTRTEAASVRRLEEVKQRLEETNRRLGTEVRERERAEASLREANADLSRVSEMKSAFVSIVSHELRTPLTSIKNAVDLVRLGRAGSLAPDQVRFLDMAHRNLDRLALIIDDLLDLSKVEAGRIEYRFTEGSVAAVVHEVAATLRPQADEGGIELVVEPGTAEACCLIDTHRLAQVLSNLVGNALKFTDEGGRVGLTVRAGTDDLVIEVSDTGSGIEPDEIERIFEPFHQAGDCLTRSVRGTGLGLSIARELAWAHGGELSVESAAGEGSRFRVHLPLDLLRARELIEIEGELRKLRKFPFTGLLALRWPAGAEPPALESEDCRQSVLAVLRDFLCETLPRDADLVLVQPAHRRIVVVLPSTPRDGCAIVRRRLERLLAERPIRIDDTELPPPAIEGPAIFPEDAPSARRLIEIMGANERKTNPDRPDLRPQPDGGISHERCADSGSGRRAGRGGNDSLPAVPGGLRGVDGGERARSSGHGTFLSA